SAPARRRGPAAGAGRGARPGRRASARSSRGGRARRTARPRGSGPAGRAARRAAGGRRRRRAARPGARRAAGARGPALSAARARQDGERAVLGLVAVLRLRVVHGLHVGLDTRSGRDTPTAEVASARQEVLAGGDVERAAVGELDHFLEDALAEGLRPDDLRAMAVLERAGDDLRRGGGALVDEHDERLP